MNYVLYAIFGNLFPNQVFMIQWNVLTFHFWWTKLLIANEASDKVSKTMKVECVFLSLNRWNRKWIHKCSSQHDFYHFTPLKLNKMRNRKKKKLMMKSIKINLFFSIKANQYEVWTKSHLFKLNHKTNGKAAKWAHLSFHELMIDICDC